MLGDAMRILVIEDDPVIGGQLEKCLKEAGHEASIRQDGSSGLATALQGKWDLLVLDVSLPGQDGFTILDQIRRARLRQPVLMLTARNAIQDRVQGLQRGADDYLTKPFSMEELLARLQALARRFNQFSSERSELPEGWSRDPLLREIRVHGLQVPLQPREWSLLEVFLEHPGEVLTNSFLLDQVWGIHFDPGTNVVNAAICRLRKKLDPPGEGSHIETLRGRGHRFHLHVQVP